MLDATWVQATGAIATGVASIVLGFFTWRLWKLESDREKSDIRAFLGRFEEDNAKLRLANQGKQADSVTALVFTEQCPNYDEKQRWEVTQWDLRPPGADDTVGELRPGATADLIVEIPDEVEVASKCAYHLEVGLALDEDFHHAIGVNSPAGHSDEQELGTRPSI